MQGERGNGLVLDLIQAAVLAGAYRALAREMPDAERGLLKMADRHSGRTAILATEISADARRNAGASATMPNTRW